MYGSNPSEVPNCEQELQKLKQDKKYANFYITGMALSGILGAISRFLSKRVKKVRI
jgi:hypothetical protein